MKNVLGRSQNEPGRMTRSERKGLNLNKQKDMGMRESPKFMNSMKTDIYENNTHTTFFETY